MAGEHAFGHACSSLMTLNIDVARIRSGHDFNPSSNIHFHVCLKARFPDVPGTFRYQAS